MSIRPSIEAIHAAADRLRGVAVHTPLVPLHSFNPRDSHDIHLKLETLQPIGSFKIRPVFNAVASRTDTERQRGLLTTSSGNTAQALAWCARYFGTTARSLMPETAPQAKIDAMREYGGTPDLIPGADVFRFMSEELWVNEPETFVHPWREMAGSGTIGLEILADMPDVETIYVPTGGGGLVGGIGSAIKALKPSVRIVAVEPEGCCALTRSLEAGTPTTVPCQTICDGVAVPICVPEVFEVLREVVDDVMLITDERAMAAVKRLALRNKVVAEPASGLGVAAALSVPKSERGRSVCIITGGSINPGLLVEIISNENLPDLAENE